MSGPRALLDLQQLDLAIDRLVARARTLETGDDLAAARGGSRRGGAGSSGSSGSRRDALDRDAGKLEHEIDSLSQKSAAEQQRMRDGSVANARELEAMGREVENLRSRITDREDQLLALMEQREDVERRATGHRRDRRGAPDEAWRRSRATPTAELDGRPGRARRAARRARRDSPASIDAEVLELYEDLRAHKKGVGAAALVDGVCQGCHETLSSVELDRVKRAEGVARCEHCRRILVL